MSYPQYQNRVEELIKRYRYNPELFTAEQVNELQEIAVSQNLDFKPKDDDFSIKKAAIKLQQGFFEGFTTISIGDEPTNTYEAIAHSLGHLAGFAPGIIAAPVRMVAGKTAGRLVQSMGQKSIPMIVGGLGQKGFEKGLAKAGAESLEFMKKGSATRSIAEQAVHLGTASAASSIWKGPDQIFDAGVHGALAGGAFGGIGNFTRFNNILKNGTPEQVKKAEGVFKASLGASLQTAPSIVNGDPIEMIIYNTLLGGYFGYSSQPAYRQEATKFISNLRNDKTGETFFRPEQNPEWNNYSKKTKDYILNGEGDWLGPVKDMPATVNESARRYVIKNNENVPQDMLESYISDRARNKFNTKEPTMDELGVIYREQADKMWNGQTYGFETVSKVIKDPDAVPGQNEVGTDTTVKTERAKPKEGEAKEPQPQDAYKPEELGVISIDADGFIKFGKAHQEMDGQQVGDKRIDRPADNLEQPIEPYTTLAYVRKNVKENPKEILYKLVKPLGSKIDKDTNNLIPDVSPKEFWRMQENLHSEHNKYIFGGVKEKGLLNIREYHIDSNIPIKSIVDALVKGGHVSKKELKQSYSDSLKIELELNAGEGPIDTVKKMHERAWKSNVLAEAERNGLYEKGGSLDRLGEIMADGYSKNVVDWNKREQLYHDKSFPLQLEGKYKYGIFSDKMVDERGKAIDEIHASDTDGTVFYNTKTHREITENTKIPEDQITAMNKPVMIAKVADGGVMAVKSAGRVAGPKLQAFMDAKGLDMVVFKSSSKHYGNQKVHDMIYSERGYESSIAPEQVLQMNKSDVRINLGTKENPDTALKGQKFVKQLFGVMNNTQFSPEHIEHVFNNYFKPSIDGTYSANQAVLAYTNTGKGSLSKLNINDVSAGTVWKIINSNSSNKNIQKLKSHFLKQIHKLHRDLDPEITDYEDVQYTSDQWAQYLQRNNRILEAAGFESDGVRKLFKYTRKHEERVMMKYFIDRYLYPKYKYSAKAWLSPKLPEFKISEGEFMADMDWNPDVIFKGKDYKLWDLWNLNRVLKGEKLSKTSEEKHKRRVKEIRKKFGKDYKDIDIKDIESALEFTTIRVPADSASGVRILKFRGFTGEKGVSIHTNGKDNEYLGGADKDSDSAFLYQGFDAKTKQGFKDNKYEWQKGNKQDGEYIPGKAEEFDSLFIGKEFAKKQKEVENSANDLNELSKQLKDGKISQEVYNNAAYEHRLLSSRLMPYKTKASKFSPSMRKMVARSAARGQQGLGFGITGKNIIMSFADAVNAKGGKHRVELIKKDDDFKYGEFEVSLKPGGIEKLRRLGREVVNRFADAADYPSQIDYSKVREILFREAFDVKWIKIPNHVKNNPKLTLTEHAFKKLSNDSLFSQVKATLNLANSAPKSYEKDGNPKSMQADAFETSVENAVRVINQNDFGNMASRILSQMKKDGVHMTGGLSPDVSTGKRSNYNLNILDKINSINREVNKLIMLGDKNLSKQELAFKKRLRRVLLGTEFNLTGDSYLTSVNLKTGKRESIIDLINMKNQWGDGPKFTTDLILDKIGNSLYTVASYNNIVKSGFNIYKSLISNGMKHNRAMEVVEKILLPISVESKRIKDIYENVGKEGGSDIWKVKLEEYDAEVRLFRNGPTLKKASEKNNIPIEYLKEYFNQWLLSPFDAGGTSSLRIGGPSKIPIQSQSIPDSSLKGLFGEFNRIYEAGIKDMKVDAKDVADTVLKSNFINTPELSTGPSQSVESTAIKIIDIVKPKTKGKQDLESIALTDKELADVRELKDNLSKNPEFAKNFNDWFPSFHKDVVGYYKDVNAMNAMDVKAVNIWLKDLSTRSTGKWGSKVPDWIFRADPRTIDEAMLLRDARLFSSFDKPVLQRDGSIKFKEVKKYMSTAGAMKEFFQRIHTLENKYISEIQDKNDKEFSFRKELTIENSTALNDLVISKRQGEEYISTDTYQKIKNKKFKIEGKEMDIDTAIDFISDKYTKVFKEVSEKWIHSPKNDKYIKYNKDGSIDVQHFFRTALEPAAKGQGLEIVPIETLLKFNYEYALEKKISDGHWKSSRAKYRKKHPFKEVGAKKFEEYFPHMDFGKTEKARAEILKFKTERIEQAFEDAIKAGKSEKEAWEAKAIEALKWDMISESGEAISSGIARDVIDGINNNVDFVALSKKTQGIGLNKRTQNILDREFDMPGYSRRTDVIDNYIENVIRNHYKLIQASMGNYQIDRFEKSKTFGKDTKDWAFVLREYLKNSLGHQTTFSEDIVNATGISKRMKGILDKSFYYNMSDQRVIDGWNKLDKSFGKHASKVPFLKNLPKVTANKTENPELYKEQVKARQEYQSRIIHELGRKEAKFQLMTLLANSGTATANMFGGSSMTIASAGFRNFRRANSSKWLTENVIKDSKGQFHLKLEEVIIDKVTGKKRQKLVKTKKHLDKWIAEQGVIDNFIQDELQLNTAWKAEFSKNKENTQNFIKEAKKIISKNPDVKDATLFELARRYNINKALLKGGAWFMAASERKLRMDAFLSHALQFRDQFGTMVKDLPLSDPAVIEAGLKGIEATQFLYHSAFRPAYMRTSLGKVLTRFKLFAFQSIRTRRELYRKAKYYGFKPGTEGFEKFKDLFLIDMMTFALGSAFSYSLFDTALPPPYDWAQETGQWLFGDKREREKAFFGQWPYPVAPLQIATPPVARIPMSVFSSLFNNDWDRFMDYHIYTMFPFGRMVRQFDKTFDEPYGTTLGRGMQQFFRLPGDKLVSKIDRAKLADRRKQEIKEELEYFNEVA